MIINKMMNAHNNQSLTTTTSTIDRIIFDVSKGALWEFAGTQFTQKEFKKDKKLENVQIFTTSQCSHSSHSNECQDSEKISLCVQTLSQIDADSRLYVYDPNS